MRRSMCLAVWKAVALSAVLCDAALAAPRITRLTPPSEWFRSGAADPVVSRFLPDQRFDLQATIVPDEGATLGPATFRINGKPVTGGVAETATSGLWKELRAGTVVASLRGVTAPEEIGRAHV